MPTKLYAAAIAAIALSATTADASPTCLKKHQPFALNADTLTVEMKLQPGADCIQGLRRSYMQIFSVKVIEPPKKGTLIIVGSGYRYMANLNEDAGEDRFTILVDGKNRWDPGSSIVTVIVNASDAAPRDPVPSVVLSGEPSLSGASLPLLL